MNMIWEIIDNFLNHYIRYTKIQQLSSLLDPNYDKIKNILHLCLSFVNNWAARIKKIHLVALNTHLLIDLGIQQIRIH